MRKTLLVMVALLASIVAKAETDGERTDWRGKGYAGFVDIGGVAGGEEILGGGIFSLTTTHGFQFKRCLFLGLGTGIEMWSGTEYKVSGDVDYDLTFVPIYAAARWNIIKRRLTPFVTMRLGGAMVDGVSEYQDEFTQYINMAVGFSAILKGDFGLNFSLGYDYKRVDSENEHKSPTLEFRGVGVKVGLEF